jgi:cobalt-zinc-cadmium efflux system membrane fusion protein
VAGGLVLVLGGGAGAYLWLPRATAPSSAPAAAPVAPAPASADSSRSSGDVVVILSEEAARRAGIAVAPVTRATASGTIRLAAAVEANAYKQVVVTPLVSGRVARVLVALGEQVTKGTPLVEVYSHELAEAQTRFLSMRAEFDAVEQQIGRTTRLVEIGAASRQELERIHAEHVSHRTEIETARSRLQLLGMAPQQIETLTTSGDVTATTTVVAPMSGAVTARAVNPGATVDPATALATIVDLSSVWILGDLYERDFASVAVGAPVTVRAAAFPDLTIAGKVGYIDPEVRAETRTARIRVEVANPGRRLRLGMLATIDVEAPGSTSQLLIPRAAVQTVGDRTVVYVSDPGTAGRYIEREVRVAPGSAEQAVVVSGLHDGDQIVSTGSFFLRAERERLGPQSPR